MSFTREDVLRELELLPVWQLRAPLLVPKMSAPEKLAENVTAKITESAPESVEIAEITAVEKTSQNTFEMHISDDKSWLFICPRSRMAIGFDIGGSQAILFNNILSALHIKKVQIYTQDLAKTGVKVIICMGEKTAQTLLNTQDSIDNLRSSHLNGNGHVLHNTPLIVTYSAAEILENLQNKAKTWHDLITALKIIGQ
jgi:uracil-DNA glycosylase